jgi:hypothetical protein
MMLVSDDSFGNRREAVEAIAASRDVERLLDADVFLVDLKAAAPVAVIAVSGSAADEMSATAGDAETTPEADESDDATDVSGTDEDVRLGIGEIDVESWTCEDCIYVVTCEKSGTLRPAACDSFQWRA